MENAIKTVIAFVIVGICIYIGVQLLPIYMDHWNFEDEVKEKVRHAFTTWNRDVDRKLKRVIIEMLRQMGAEFKEKDVSVNIKKGTKKIIVEVWYSRSHNLPVLQNPKMFYLHHESATVKNL